MQIINNQTLQFSAKVFGKCLIKITEFSCSSKSDFNVVGKAKFWIGEKKHNPLLNI
jgi:hypothetical protein